MYARPTIYNKTLTDANTEYSQAVSADAKKVLIRERSGSYDVKLAYATGTSGTLYITLPAGSSKYLEGIWVRGLTLFMQSTQAGVVVEVEEWKR
jgi:hypothetical protein